MAGYSLVRIPFDEYERLLDQVDHTVNGVAHHQPIGKGAARPSDYLAHWRIRAAVDEVLEFLHIGVESEEAS